MLPQGLRALALVAALAAPGRRTAGTVCVRTHPVRAEAHTPMASEMAGFASPLIAELAALRRTRGRATRWGDQLADLLRGRAVAAALLRAQVCRSALPVSFAIRPSSRVGVFKALDLIPAYEEHGGRLERVGMRARSAAAPTSAASSPVQEIGGTCRRTTTARVVAVRRHLRQRVPCAWALPTPGVIRTEGNEPPFV